MIIPKRWQDVEPGTRVKDPAGQIFHVLSRFGPLVRVRDLKGEDHVITIDPGAHVPTVLDPEDLAVACLRKHFPTIEFLKEGR